ncbi:MAG: radical SAM protein [Magnetococcus sp. DMHC-6]
MSDLNTKSDFLPWPPLENLHIYQTNQCHQKCGHCWVKADSKCQDSLSAKIAKSAIIEALPLGLRRLKISGGEPLLNRSETLEILLHAHDYGLKTKIETNAIVCDTNLAVSFRNMNVTVTTSLDGATAKTHDSLRNTSESFNITLNNINKLVSNDVIVEIVSSIYSCNAHEMESIVWLCERLGVTNLKFNFPSLYGRALTLKKDALCTSQSILNHIKKIENIFFGKIRMEIKFDIPRAFLSKPDAGPRCSILNLLSILPDKRYSICGIGITLKKLTFGIAGRDQLDQIWKTNKTLLKMRQTIPNSGRGICGQCTEYQSCFGHCISYGISKFGSLNGPHPFCHEAFKQNLFPISKLKSNEHIFTHTQ